MHPAASYRPPVPSTTRVRNAPKPNSCFSFGTALDAPARSFLQVPAGRIKKLGLKSRSIALGPVQGHLSSPVE